MAAQKSGTSRTGQSPQGEVERVYDLLLEWLMDAVLPPGMFLSEPDLAERCSTSRTPVREACMRLFQDRWLTRYPGRGFLVTPISSADIEDLYEYRILLESFAAGKVAAAITPSQFAELKGLLEDEDGPDPDYTALVHANETFHLRLAEFAGNARVLDQLRLSLHFARRLDTLYLRVDQQWIGHGELFAAFERRDPEAARQAMAAHLGASRSGLTAVLAHKRL